MTQSGTFTFACPRCRAVAADTETKWVCTDCGARYTQVNGVWDFLSPTEEAPLFSFIEEYEAIRLAEGRGSADPAYYWALPYPPKGTPRAAEWAQRAESYRLLLNHALQLLEGGGRQLRILDLGAGNGWLSNRLAQRGHSLLAVDLTINDFDGLGCIRHYTAPIAAARANFDRLPLPDRSVDLVIFNASIHYAGDYAITLTESLRVLRTDGRLAIVDTPVYRDANSGRAMLAERRLQFRAAYGRASDVLPLEGYLTHERLGELGATLGLEWHWHRSLPGWRMGLRALRGRVRHGREVAQFPLLVAVRASAGGPTAGRR